jgi:hypothetical protein
MVPLPADITRQRPSSPCMESGSKPEFLDFSEPVAGAAGCWCGQRVIGLPRRHEGTEGIGGLALICRIFLVLYEFNDYELIYSCGGWGRLYLVAKAPQMVGPTKENLTS